jgi:hypothetical protein
MLIQCNSKIGRSERWYHRRGEQRWRFGVAECLFARATATCSYFLVHLAQRRHGQSDLCLHRIDLMRLFP